MMALSRSFAARALVLTVLLSSIALSAACGTVHAPVPGPTATATPDRPPATVYLSGISFPSESSAFSVSFVTALNLADGSVRWSNPLGGRLLSVDGNVYLQTSIPPVGTTPTQDFLLALRSDDGTVRWRYDTPPTFALATGTGVVYLSYPVDSKVSDHQVLAQAGVVLALDAMSGTLLWQTNVTGPPLADPVLAGTSVYLALGSPTISAPTPGPFNVIALDAHTGVLRWHYTSAEPAQVSTIGDSVVYVEAFGHNRFGQADDTLVALEAGNGDMRWRLSAGGVPYGPLLVNGALYFVATTQPTDPNSERQYVAESADAHTGKVRWQTPLTYLPTQLEVAGGSVYIGCAGAASLTSGVHRVIALDARTGAIRWSSGDGPFSEIGASSMPVVSDGVLYTLTDAATRALGTRVTALDARDGTTLWEASVSNEWLDQPIVAGGRIYALTLGYRPHLVVLTAQTGAELWRYPDQHGVAGSMVLGQ
jgi:outer membrane protein assembly factor BamB